MVVVALQSKIIIDSISIAVIALFTSYHFLRFRLLGSIRTSSEKKWFNLENVSTLIIVSSTLPRLISFVYAPAYYSSNHYLNDESCVYSVIAYLVIGGIIKFGIHLFVVLRSRVCQTGPTATDIWYKIGLLMVFSDVMFVVYILSCIRRIHATYKLGVCIPSLDESIPLWYGASDFIIGIYCLIAFIAPLRKFIKLEEAQRGIDDSVTLVSMTKKVMLWSSVMLISTIIALIIASIYPPANEWVFPLDQTLNVICVIMQFSKVPASHIPPKYVCFISWMQCQCHRDMKAAQATTMMKFTDVIISSAPTLTVNSTANTTTTAVDVSQQNDEQNPTECIPVSPSITMPRAKQMQQSYSDTLKKATNLRVTLVRSSSNPTPHSQVLL